MRLHVRGLLVGVSAAAGRPRPLSIDYLGTDVHVPVSVVTVASSSEGDSCTPTFLRIMHLIECEDCHTSKHSLRQWASHLVDRHAVPSEWPSERASRLPANVTHNPYTFVTESKKKRKPGAIPRPLNSFMLFAQHIRRNILQEFDGVSNADLSRYLGELWSTLPRPIKTQFDEEATRLGKLHQFEFPHYKYQPNKRLQPVIPTNVNETMSGLHADSGIDNTPRINLPSLTLKKTLLTPFDSAYVSSCELSPSHSLSASPPISTSPAKLPFILPFHNSAHKRPPSDYGGRGSGEFCMSPPPRQRFMSAENGAPSTMNRHTQHPPARSNSCCPLASPDCLLKPWQPTPTSREAVVPVVVVRGSIVKEFSMTIKLDEETTEETSAGVATPSREDFVLRPSKTEEDNNLELKQEEELGESKQAFWSDREKSEWQFVGDAHLVPIQTEDEEDEASNFDSLLAGIDLRQLLSQSVDELLTSVDSECCKMKEMTTDGAGTSSGGCSALFDMTDIPLSELLTDDSESFDFGGTLQSDGSTLSPVLA
nr:unnamed protein product [Spirometra erinaceieuropaei]